MHLLEDFPDFQLWHNPTCAGLYATWRGKHDSTLTRVRYELIYRHLRATGSTKLLNDSLLDEDGWSQVAIWLSDTCFDLLADAGLQAVAWVLPRHTEAIYDTARVLARLQRPLVDTFTDAQAAHDWLHRWPRPTHSSWATGNPLTAATFLLLPPHQQLQLTYAQGRALPPRWETDFYVKPYQVLDVLVVELYYQLHSGIFHQLQVRLRNAEEGV